MTADAEPAEEAGWPAAEGHGDHGDRRPARRREAFYGRLKGKRLRPRQEHLLLTRLPGLALDLTRPAPADLGSLFDVVPVPGKVRLEIGFGGGEHLLRMAARHPDTGFIGVEPFVNGMAKLLAALDEAPLTNIRLYPDDAAALLDWLPPRSIDALDLLYPDPWPKRKHWKRRFVSPVNLARFARVLKPGGLFRFASDIDTYVDWTLLHCRGSGRFDWTAASPGDWHRPYEGWPGTRYEAKALKEGRRPAYLTFRRRDDQPG